VVFVAGVRSRCPCSGVWLSQCVGNSNAGQVGLGEDFMILACVVFTQCQCVSDGQTDGQTDRHSDDG